MQNVVQKWILIQRRNARQRERDHHNRQLAKDFRAGKIARIGAKCACGNDAAFRRDGDWICERCADLQSKYEAAELRRVTCGERGIGEYRLHLPTHIQAG